MTLASREVLADAAPGPGCYTFLPGELHLPSNAPAIPGNDESVNAVAQIVAAPIGQVSFVVSADPRAEVSRGRGFLVRPSGPLPEGSSKLAWALTCSIPTSGGTEAERAIRLVVGPPSPQPSSVGTVTPGAAPSVIRFVLSPELAAYVEVAQLNVTVGALKESFWAWHYGEVGEGATMIEVGYAPTRDFSVAGSLARSVSQLMDASDLCAGRTGTASFPVELSAHIAGADVDPSPARGSVAVDCDAARQAREAATVSFAESGCAQARLSRTPGGWIAGLVFGTAAALALIARRRDLAVPLPGRKPGDVARARPSRRPPHA